jgi:uncharacterized protein YlxW (UPF0749 family)
MLVSSLSKYRTAVTVAVLRALVIFAPIAWLLSLDMFCDLAYIVTSILSMLLLSASRDLLLRRSVEEALEDSRSENAKLAQLNNGLEANVSSLQATNKSLEQTASTLQNDLTMLKETIG